jgi:hypothetical protein
MYAGVKKPVAASLVGMGSIAMMFGLSLSLVVSLI